jgi:hypothetical protein
MKPLCFLPLFFLLLFTFETTAQKNFVESQIGKQLAQVELNQTIFKEKVNNVVNSKFSLIKTGQTAVAVAEPLLFSVYGERTIIESRPYDVHKIDNYWVILGKNAREAAGSGGGYFLLILHETDSRVIRMDYLRR